MKQYSPSFVLLNTAVLQTPNRSCYCHGGKRAAAADDDILYNQCYQGFSIDFNPALQLPEGVF